MVAPSGCGIQPFQGAARTCRSVTSFFTRSFFHGPSLVPRPLRRRCFLFSSVHALESCTFLLYLYSLIVGPGGWELCSQLPLETVFERHFYSFTQDNLFKTTPLPFLRNGSITFSLLHKARWVTQIALIVPREASLGCQKITIPRWPTQMMLPSTYP